MNTITLASNSADSAAFDAIVSHHFELSGALALKTGHFLDAVTSLDNTLADTAKAEITAWSRNVLLPALSKEWEVFDPALHRTMETAALEADVSQDRTRLANAVERFDAAHERLAAVAVAVELRVILASLLKVQAETALPAIAMSVQDSLATLWAGIAPVVRDTAERLSTPAATAETGHFCECGVLDEDAYPELDVRTVPHVIRHATVFGALDSIDSGAGIVLIAPHDPLPLLGQLEDRAPGRFTVRYLSHGPDEWRIQLLRA